MHHASRLWRSGLVSAVLALAAAASSIGQEPGSDARAATRTDRRKDYETLLALPAADRERIKKLVGDLSEEDAETQARLLQVARRYATWLNRLPADDRLRVEQAADSAQRVRLIREIRERQWITTLTPAERERIATVTKHRDYDHFRQAVLWSTSLAGLGLPPGVPGGPVPPLDERQRLLAFYKQREHQLELERQLALTQGTDRQEVMQRELQRIRRELLDPSRKKPISNEDRLSLQSTPADGTIGYISTLLELARKYDVPLPEPPRRPNLPRVPQPELLEFARIQLSEAMLRDFESRLKDPKQRPQAMAELNRLYWNAHPTKLAETRQAEAKKRKEGKSGPE